MRKYDLAKMLAEIRRDEGGAKEAAPVRKQVLTQAQIKAMARARRKPGKPPDK